jgi:hypothetical protein
MNHAKTSFRTEICAGAVICVAQYLAPLREMREASECMRLHELEFMLMCVLREIDSAPYHCEDVGVASCSSDILCCYNCTLGSVSSVYPDSVNFKDSLLIVPSTVDTSFHSGLTL